METLTFNQNIIKLSIFLLVVQICVKNIRCQDADDEEAFVPIKCYECGGEKGKCNDADDLGVEKTCDKGTVTCVVARDEDGGVTRRCDTTGNLHKQCLNDGDFCYCLGDLCNTAIIPAWSLSLLTGSAILANVMKIVFI